MGLVNGGFETAGANPGDADSWSTVEAAAFTGTLFDTDKRAETFDSGWSNTPYYPSWADASSSFFLFSAAGIPTSAEDFSEWGSDMPLTLP